MKSTRKPNIRVRRQVFGRSAPIPRAPLITPTPAMIEIKQRMQTVQTEIAEYRRRNSNTSALLAANSDLSKHSAELAKAFHDALVEKQAKLKRPSKQLDAQIREMKKTYQMFKAKQKRDAEKLRTVLDEPHRAKLKKTTRAPPIKPIQPAIYWENRWKELTMFLAKNPKLSKGERAQIERNLKEAEIKFMLSAERGKWN